MTTENNSQIASFIWNICNLLHDAFKRNEYRKVILPLTVLRRFDCILAATHPEVLKDYGTINFQRAICLRQPTLDKVFTGELL